MLNMRQTPFSVVFLDHVDDTGVGIKILFKDAEGVKHTEFMGDADYNTAIVDWILFGTYKPLEEREEWGNATPVHG